MQYKNIKKIINFYIFGGWLQLRILYILKIIKKIKYKITKCR